MPENTTKNIVQGISWSVIMRWSLKFLGLINVAILARLLSPEDYGVVAMATLAYGIVTLFVDFGAGMLVIRAEKVTDELLNAAWTAKVLQGIILASLLLLLTPLFIQYFDNQVLADIMLVYALSAFVSGFENIGIFLFRRNLEYKQDFSLEVWSKVGAVVITIALAIWLRSFWALVFGHLAASVLRLALTYIKHPYRPSVNIRGVKPFLLFSVSLVAINIGKYSSQNISILVGGRILATEALGILNVAANFASIFTQEIMLPVARAMFPQYAKLKQDTKALTKAYLGVLSALAMILIPVGTGVSVVAPELVRIILGEQWLETIGLIQWLAFAGVLRALIWIKSGNILIVTGNERKSAWCSWLQLAILLPLVIYGGLHSGAMGLVQATVVASAITLPIMIAVLTTAIDASYLRVLSYLIRPALASAVMYYAIDNIHWPEINVLIMLLCKALLGIVIYIITIFILWWLIRRPAGIEDKVWQRLVSKLR